MANCLRPVRLVDRGSGRVNPRFARPDLSGTICTRSLLTLQKRV
jgi:hypothetical protein